MEKLVKLLDNFNRDLSPFAGEAKYTIWDDSVELAKYLIENDVRQVVHGRWEKTSYFDVHKCSCCGKYSNTYKGLHDYCPKCGAKMDLEE